MKLIDSGNKEILVTRYFTGEATPEEIIEIQKWLSESKDNLLYFRQLKNVWDNTENATDLRNVNVDTALNLVNKRIRFRTPAATLWFYWKRIAAVLIIPLLLANLLYFIYNAPDKITTQEPV